MVLDAGRGQHRLDPPRARRDPGLTAIGTRASSAQPARKPRRRDPTSRLDGLDLLASAVVVLDAAGNAMGEAGVKITSAIHPEAIFVVHGFGHDLPCESRAVNKGVSDSKCLRGGLDVQDAGGGGLAMQEHFVSLQKVARASA